MTVIRSVLTPRDRRRFLHLPYRLYREDPLWVPPLLREEALRIDGTRHPFFLHARVHLALAEKDGGIAGRIAVILNPRHNDFHGEKTAFFGLFECVEDASVAHALFNWATSLALSEGMEVLRGPVNLSTNDISGWLIEGDATPPVLMMPYNPPYYVRFAEDEGFRPAKDLLAYTVDDQAVRRDRLERVARRLKDRSGIQVRPMDMKRFASEVEKIREVYNDAWSRNWGFVPMTEEEFDFMAQQLRAGIVADLALLAEAGSEVVGFCLSLPDYNQAIAPLGGRLFPFGWARLLWGVRSIRKLRTITLGVRHKLRRRGVEVLLLEETIRRGLQLGYRESELSWVLEDNLPMRQAAEKLGAHISKRYRICEKVLA